MTAYGSLELTPAVKQRMLPAWTPQPHTLSHTSVYQSCAAVQQKAPPLTPEGQQAVVRSAQRIARPQAARARRRAAAAGSSCSLATCAAH